LSRVLKNNLRESRVCKNNLLQKLLPSTPYSGLLTLPSTLQLDKTKDLV
jgi:hypothetical protein